MYKSTLLNFLDITLYRKHIITFVSRLRMLTYVRLTDAEAVAVAINRKSKYVKAVHQKIGKIQYESM